VTISIGATLLMLALNACTKSPPENTSGGAGGAGGGALAGTGGANASPQAGVGAGVGGIGGIGGAGVGGAGGTGAAPVDASTEDAALSPTDARTLDADPIEPVICPPTAVAAGDHDGSASSDGRERTYVMHVPSGYSGNEPVALVFDFHGYGSSGAGQMGASGFRELSDQHGFIAVYPDGVGGSWHVNGCCGQAAEESLDEVAAVRAILDDVKAQVCVDPARIYASGISQGGGMAHHVGCLAADVFAAVAPVSSDLRTEPCMPVRPISELSFRGTADGLSLYEGGPVGPAGMQYQSIGAQATLERWRMIDECSGAVESVLDVCETYATCKAGTEVTLCSITGGGHVLYDNPLDFDVAATAWAMFERQRL
jgi:polyhydroxybutyrate depolymerase